MGRKKPKKPALPVSPNKEQRFEMVKYRLLSGHLIPNISARQAERLIRRNRVWRAMHRVLLKAWLMPRETWRVLQRVEIVPEGEAWG